MNDLAPNRLLLASNNQHKLIEFRRILSHPRITIVGPADIGIAIDVEETGSSMAENARIKALAFAAECELPVIADDSGLEVDALDGAPGLHSRRFEGLESDDARNRRLLELLEGMAGPARAARFRCAIALARGTEMKYEFEATCEGAIAAEPGGSQGFGYDPIFIPDGAGGTFAELGAAIKDRISHRSRALRALRSFIDDAGGGVL